MTQDKMPIPYVLALSCLSLAGLAICVFCILGAISLVYNLEGIGEKTMLNTKRIAIINKFIEEKYNDLPTEASITRKCVKKDEIIKSCFVAGKN